MSSRIRLARIALIALIAGLAIAGTVRAAVPAGRTADQRHGELTPGELALIRILGDSMLAIGDPPAACLEMARQPGGFCTHQINAHVVFGVGPKGVTCQFSAVPKWSPFSRASMDDERGKRKTVRRWGTEGS